MGLPSKSFWANIASERVGGAGHETSLTLCYRLHVDHDLSGDKTMSESVFFGIPNALLAGFLFLFFLAWSFLPFAVFGTKPILKEILQEQKRIRIQLEKRNDGGGVDSGDVQ